MPKSWRLGIVRMLLTIVLVCGLLPAIAQDNLCCAGKDISMAGLSGTLLMLLETSGVGAVLDLDAVVKPDGVAWEKWLTSFPSYGYLLAVPLEHVESVQQLFQPHGLTCLDIGRITSSSQVVMSHGDAQEILWDSSNALTGFGRAPN